MDSSLKRHFRYYFYSEIQLFFLSQKYGYIDGWIFLNRVSKQEVHFIFVFWMIYFTPIVTWSPLVLWEVLQVNQVMYFTVRMMIG